MCWELCPVHFSEKMPQIMPDAPQLHFLKPFSQFSFVCGFLHKFRHFLNCWLFFVRPRVFVASSRCPRAVLASSRCPRAVLAQSSRCPRAILGIFFVVWCDFTGNFKKITFCVFLIEHVSKVGSVSGSGPNPAPSYSNSGSCCLFSS